MITNKMLVTRGKIVKISKKITKAKGVKELSLTGYIW